MSLCTVCKRNMVAQYRPTWTLLPFTDIYSTGLHKHCYSLRTFVYVEQPLFTFSPVFHTIPLLVWNKVLVIKGMSRGAPHFLSRQTRKLGRFYSQLSFSSFLFYLVHASYNFARIKMFATHMEFLPFSKIFCLFTQKSV